MDSCTNQTAASPVNRKLPAAEHEVPMGHVLSGTIYTEVTQRWSKSEACMPPRGESTRCSVDSPKNQSGESLATLGPPAGRNEALV